MSIRIGIVGISGYGGGEALRHLANHPVFELTYADVSGLFQSNRLHVGDVTWAAGVGFEF